MTEPEALAQKFIRRYVDSYEWRFEKKIHREFQDLPLESKIIILANGFTQSLLKLTKIEYAEQLLGSLQTYSQALSRLPRVRDDDDHSGVLEEGAKLFRPLLNRWPDDPDHRAFKKLYYKVFRDTKGAGASQALAGAADAYEEFEQAWKKYLREKRVVLSRSGIPARREFAFEGDLFLSYQALNISRIVYDVFGAARRAPATELLALAGLATTAEPPVKWIQKFDELAPKLPAELIRRAIREIHRFHVVDDFPVPPKLRRILVGPTTEAKYLAGGVVWAASRFMDDACLDDMGKMARLHSRLGDSAGVLGPYLIHAIARSGHPKAVHALQHLDRDIRHKNMKKVIAKVLGKLAAEKGLSKSQLEDQSAETHGLDSSGQRSWDLGRYRIVLSLRERGGPSLAVFDRALRKEVDPPPASLQKKAAFGEIRKIQVQLAKDEQLQRRRLEEAMIAGRSWTLEAWRETVADHPLVGHLARRILWRIQDSGKVRHGFFGAGWKDVDGCPFKIGGPATLSIPHPVDLGLHLMRKGQTFVVKHRSAQPFKQLFRETYVVTPAELKTSTYSNRFAAHIVPHKQMYALLKSRGWKGFGGFGFDGGDQGWRVFPEMGFRAEMVRDQDSVEGNGLVTLSHISFSVSNPSTRSYSPVNLKEVPPVVFSETMRDVDLVASVAGVGTDKYWRDWSQQLEAGAVRWEETRDRYSTLHVVPASVRRRLLEELLPILKLEGKVQFDGPWALVQGRLHRYRIHLGSGGIHLEPQGRYVCIVQAGRDPLAEVFVGQDDPQTLVILSKIHLLVHDDRITNPDIRRQLK